MAIVTAVYIIFTILLWWATRRPVALTREIFEATHRSSYPGELSHLLASLVAFLDEHRYCGEMDGGADEEWIWMTCTCGAVISRALEPAIPQ